MSNYKQEIDKSKVFQDFVLGETYGLFYRNPREILSINERFGGYGRNRIKLPGGKQLSDKIKNQDAAKAGRALVSLWRIGLIRPRYFGEQCEDVERKGKDGMFAFEPREFNIKGEPHSRICRVPEYLMESIPTHAVRNRVDDILELLEVEVETGDLLHFVELAADKVAAAASRESSPKKKMIMRLKKDDVPLLSRPGYMESRRTPQEKTALSLAANKNHRMLVAAMTKWENQHYRFWSFVGKVWDEIMLEKYDHLQIDNGGCHTPRHASSILRRIHACRYNHDVSTEDGLVMPYLEAEKQEKEVIGNLSLKDRVGGTPHFVEKQQVLWDMQCYASFLTEKNLPGGLPKDPVAAIIGAYLWLRGRRKEPNYEALVTRQMLFLP